MLAPRINRAIHPTGLLRGHVGERPRDELRRYGHLTLVSKLGCDPKAGEPHVSGIIDECVRGLHVLMDEAVPVDVAKCCRQTDSNAQKASQIDRLSLVPLDDPI